ncbi:MAG: hypothetical protein KIS72_05520, partial [Luteimonas sp.]|nr:hypothetical protein [Luteimonas sp.]
NILQVNPAADVETPYCEPTSREPWTSGRKVAGSNNWVQSAAALVPAEWTGTLRGADPLFANIAQFQLRPEATSPLVSAGNPQPPTPSAFPFPSPLALPLFDPPQRVKMAIDAQVARVHGTRIDIGALESLSGGIAPRRRNGSQPLPTSVASSSSAPAAVAAAARSAAPSGSAGDNGKQGASTAASATSASAAAQQRGAVRITPPAVRLWQRWLQWFGAPVVRRDHDRR